MIYSERLSDLDELVLRCRTAQAREYVAEAVACYRAGAYRACIVNTWISIVFDLVDKIRELSVSGDKIAEVLLQQFETYQQQINQGNDQGIKKALEFEREILSLVRDKLQFFDQQQYLDLCRLREDRHRCAHPSFHRIENPYRPTAELARLHLRNAIVHVLQQPPVQGKAALTELRALIASQYFPRDPERAIVQLKNSPLARANEALLCGFVDMLVLGFFDDGQSLKFAHQVVPAIKAALVMNRDIVEQRLKTQLNKVIKDVKDKDFIGAAYMALDIKDAWGLLSESSMDKINHFIKKGPSEEVIALLKDASEIDYLRDAVVSRLDQLSVEELSKAITEYFVGKIAVPRAVYLFSEVRSWIGANQIADKVVFPLLAHFTKEDIEVIVRAPKEKQADLPGSTGFANFLAKVKELGIVTTEELDAMLKDNDLGHYAKKN